MPTSGSYVLPTTGAELCYTANEILGQYGADVTSLTAADETFALKLLNWYMKTSQYVGGFLWKRKVAFLFMNLVETEYTISTSGAHCTNGYTTAIVESDAVIGTHVLNLSNTVGMQAADTVLIPLLTGLYQANTIDTVDSLTQITLDDPLDEDIAATTRIYTYQDKISKPMRAYSYGLRLYSEGDASNIPLDRSIDALSFDDYWTNTPQKVQQSQPTAAVYMPGRDVGKLYTQGRNYTTQMILMFTYQEELQSITNAAQEPDYPSEWFLPIAFKLAYYLSYYLEFDSDRRSALDAEAERGFMRINAADQETAPMQITLTGDRRGF